MYLLLYYYPLKTKLQILHRHFCHYRYHSRSPALTPYRRASQFALLATIRNLREGAQPNALFREPSLITTEFPIRRNHTTGEY